MEESTTSKDGSTLKRSANSISIGLQTQYSHQQHLARYCMLPHSKPHVPKVKKYNNELTNVILDAYLLANKVLEASAPEKSHPFFCRGDQLCDDNELARHELRKQLLEHICSQSHSPNIYDIHSNIMFEACTLQPTGPLGFHRDIMNCNTLDKTIALIAPCSQDATKCLSFLYYTRKCVGEYTKRRGTIHTYLKDNTSSPLTQICLKSIMATGGIFDYQGSLFERDISLNKIGQRFEKNVDTQCTEVANFCGLSCFKYGASFDKMGYYSILVNVFMSLYYMELIKSVDDSISLCMYFGLLCNGTSCLAAVWNDIHVNMSFAKDWCQKKEDNTKLFRILVMLERQRRLETSCTTVGSCKLPRFQYANYSSYIIDNADNIHCHVKDFLLWRNEHVSNRSDVTAQHSHLYDTLKDAKGIGPMSFNQLWHSLCLCGVLPHHYIQTSAIGIGSGPAKLIQSFNNSCKSAAGLMKEMHDVKNEISKMGMKRISDFFLENLMCELWRLTNRKRVMSQKMTTKQRCDALLSPEFVSNFRSSIPTKQPDIYFRNPFTNDYQHLFRVVDKDLIMRPSFLDNSTTSSVTLQCAISHDKITGIAQVSWNGDYLRFSKQLPSIWFIADT
jgi:hypothetical protein